MQRIFACSWIEFSLWNGYHRMTFCKAFRASPIFLHQSRYTKVEGQSLSLVLCTSLDSSYRLRYRTTFRVFGSWCCKWILATLHLRIRIRALRFEQPLQGMCGISSRSVLLCYTVHICDSQRNSFSCLSGDFHRNTHTRFYRPACRICTV